MPCEFTPQIFRVGRGYRLAQFRESHPVDAHRFAAMLHSEIIHPFVMFATGVSYALPVDSDCSPPISYVPAVDTHHSGPMLAWRCHHEDAAFKEPVTP